LFVRLFLLKSTMSSGDIAVTGVDATPVRRRLGTSTDDAAIFFEDTVDRVTAQCIEASPSALALLTPQRLPTGQALHVDVTEYDACHLGSLARSSRKSAGNHNDSATGGGGGERSHPSSTSKRSGSDSGTAGRPSGPRAALHDVTNTSSVKLNFSSSSRSNSKSPTPKPARLSTSRINSSSNSGHRCSDQQHHQQHHHHHHRGGSQNSSLALSTPRRISAHDRSPSAAEPTVPLADFEALQKERNRFEKMYEHQRALYEEMAEKQAETYQTLQDKIIEVVALSTRNEESKRFIRQLKREFSESRTRVMDMQNKALAEAKTERNTKSRYEALIQEQERKYDRLVERHETKLAGMESLLKDLTCLRGDQEQLHVSQLDSLLKAAYSKSTALFSDLLRQGRQIDLLYEAKSDLEGQLEQLRREKRETESMMREERRRMMSETERLIEQIEEQQQSILNLRQMLIRTMDNRDNVFAWSRGPRRVQRHHGGSGETAEADEEDRDGVDSDTNTSSSSSFASSSPSSIVEEGEEQRSFNEGDMPPYHDFDEVEEGGGDGGDDTPLHRDCAKDRTKEEEECVVEAGQTNPLFASTTARVSRGGQSRPIISTSVVVATAPVLASNAVVVSRRGSAPASAVTTVVPSRAAAAAKMTEASPPPLPLSSRSDAASSPASPASVVVRQEQPYRILRRQDNTTTMNDGGRVENDENSHVRMKSKPGGTGGGGSSNNNIARDARPLSSMSLFLHTRDKKEAACGEVEHNGCGGGGRVDAAAASSSVGHLSPSSAPTSASTGSRRRLDFTSALAAVTEKRRRDREARDAGVDTVSDGRSDDAVPIRRSNGPSSTEVKEGATRSGTSAEGRRVVVRSCAVGSIATARTSSGAVREEEEEEEPRLFPRAGACPRE
jgi:hypothetical protein